MERFDREGARMSMDAAAMTGSCFCSSRYLFRSRRRRRCPGLEKNGKWSLGQVVNVNGSAGSLSMMVCLMG